MAWRLGLQPRRGCGWWGAFSLPHIVASLQYGVIEDVTARAVNVAGTQAAAIALYEEHPPRKCRREIIKIQLICVRQSPFCI